MEKITDIQDALIRAVLVEQVENTSKYSKKLENYVWFELSQKDAIDLLNRKFYLNEAILNTDIEREQQIEKYSTPLFALSAFGLAMLSGGGKAGEHGRLRSLVDKGISATKIDLISPKKERGEFISGAVTAWLIGHGAYLVTKAVTFLLKKAVLVCNRNCESSIPRNTNDPLQIRRRKLLVTICTLKCRLSGMEKVLSKLKSEASMCDRTKNPYKCKSTLYTKIGQIQEKYLDEKKELAELIAVVNRPVVPQQPGKKV